MQELHIRVCDIETQANWRIRILEEWQTSLKEFADKVARWRTTESAWNSRRGTCTDQECDCWEMRGNILTSVNSDNVAAEIPGSRRTHVSKCIKGESCEFWSAGIRYAREGLQHMDGELRRDSDFKKAVRYVIIRNCYVDGGYIYC